MENQHQSLAEQQVRTQQKALEQQMINISVVLLQVIEPAIAQELSSGEADANGTGEGVFKENAPEEVEPKINSLNTLNRNAN